MYAYFVASTAFTPTIAEPALNVATPLTDIPETSNRAAPIATAPVDVTVTTRTPPTGIVMLKLLPEPSSFVVTVRTDPSGLKDLIGRDAAVAVASAWVCMRVRDGT